MYTKLFWFGIILLASRVSFAQAPKTVRNADGFWFNARIDNSGVFVEKRSPDYDKILWRRTPRIAGIRDLRTTPEGGVAILTVANAADLTLQRWDAEGNLQVNLSFRFDHPSMAIDDNGDFLLAGGSLSLLRLGPDGVEKTRRTLPDPGLELGPAAIELDRSGHLFLIGSTQATTLAVTADAYQKASLAGLCPVVTPMSFTYPPCRVGWIARVETSTFDLEALSYLGGADSNALYGLAVDREGRPVVVGTAEQRQPGRDPYPSTPNTVRTQPAGLGTVLTISRLTSRLDALVDSTWLRGSQTAGGGYPSVDGDGRVVVVGSTTSTDFPATASANTLCGPRRGPRPELTWNVAIRLGPHFETIDRVLHLNEYVAPLRVPLESTVTCLFGDGNYLIEKAFGAGQLMTLIGGPFEDNEEVRVAGIRARELYRSTMQINFVLPRELGFRESADVTVGGVFARTIRIEETWPRWKWLVTPDGSWYYPETSLIDARRPDGSQHTPTNPFAIDEVVRAYATGIDLAKPLFLFLDQFSVPYANFTATYVPGTFDSVVEFRFPNPVALSKQGGRIQLDIVNGGVPTTGTAGILISAPQP